MCGNRRAFFQFFYLNYLHHTSGLKWTMLSVHRKGGLSGGGGGSKYTKCEY